jgi:HK97 family phage prohead protease
MKSFKKLFLSAEAKGVIDETNKILSGVVGSSGIVDRQGESIDPKGWDLKNFMKNPIILFAHDYSSLPIGKALKTWVENGKLMFNIKFADTEMANEVFKLFKDKFLNAFSVGFMPLELATDGKFTFSKTELLELSAVPVPANPEALSYIKSNAPLMFKELEAMKKEVTPVEHGDSPDEDIENDPMTDPDKQWQLDYPQDKPLTDLTAGQFAELLLFVMGTNDPDYARSTEDIRVKAGRTISAKHESLLNHAVKDVGTVLASVAESGDQDGENQGEPNGDKGIDPLDPNNPDGSQKVEVKSEIVKDLTAEEKKLKLLRMIKGHTVKADQENGKALKLMKQLITPSNSQQSAKDDGERN